MKAQKVHVTLDGALLNPSEYVAAIELAGRDVTVQIADIRVEDLVRTDGSSERKPVITFRGKSGDRKLVLNRTNLQSIARVHGTEARRWIGQKITLYPTTCRAFGQVVDCIRVRESQAPGSVPAPAAGGDATAPSPGAAEPSGETQ